MPTASPRGDRQSQSRKGPSFDGPQLDLVIVREQQAVDAKLIRQQPTLLSAIKLCISYAGLEADKEVYLPLGIDAGHWTRITRGEAHFSVDKLCALMDLCGNEAPLMWLVDTRGYELASLHRRESETERENRLLREENAALRRVLQGHGT
jgi:hypothetical protein